MATPAELLVGQTIEGWYVDRQLGVYPGMTGGHFSSGYIVTKDGKEAFLKAMDLHSAARKGIDEINRATQQYTFERELLGFCGDQRLSHVVRLLHHGEHHAQNLPEGMPSMFYTVYYMIFELSDGDIRRELTFNVGRLASWKLHVLHQAAVGLTQLHTVNVTHQDLKPSNVLGFSERKIYKLGDLGRSKAKHLAAPTDSFIFSGDYTYAPPEYQYRYEPPDYHDRRIGSDAYLLGSLISFLFTSIGAITSTLFHLPDQYKPAIWDGAYADVLPFLESAHTKAAQGLRSALPTTVADDLTAAYFNLCHPNPAIRGHPKARRQAGRPIGLERYVSQFSLLKVRLEVAEKKG